MSAVSMVLATMVKIENFSPMGFAMDTPMAFAIPWVFPQESQTLGTMGFAMKPPIVFPQQLVLGKYFLCSPPPKFSEAPASLALMIVTHSLTDGLMETGDWKF